MAKGFPVSSQLARNGPKAAVSTKTVATNAHVVVTYCLLTSRGTDQVRTAAVVVMAPNTTSPFPLDSTASTTEPVITANAVQLPFSKNAAADVIASALNRITNESF